MQWSEDVICVAYVEFVAFQAPSSYGGYMHAVSDDKVQRENLITMFIIVSYRGVQIYRWSTMYVLCIYIYIYILVLSPREPNI